MYTAAPDRYTAMTYRRSGRSGLLLPAISLGLWQNFGHARSFDVQRETLWTAFDLGVTHFDLANNYGPPPGAAEETFGRVLATDFRPYRDELIISTKAGYEMWDGPYGDHGSRKYLLSSLDQSLQRMDLDYVDIFYHHRPDPDTPIEETAGALASAVTQGKALYVGVSNYSPEQTIAMAGALEPWNLRLLIHQPAYNMLNRGIENGLLATLDAEGIGCIVFVPLAQGLLTDRYLHGDIPAGSRAAENATLQESSITESYLQKVRALNEVAANRGQSLAQLAVLWILRHPGMTSALIGASSAAQLRQNVASLDAAPLSVDELSRIDDILSA